MTTEAVLNLATPIAVIIAAVIQQLSALRARNATREVKETLANATSASDVKLEAIAKTAESVHTLVNSNMSAALRTAAFATRRVADLTKHPDDIAVWQLAEKAWRDHEAKQRVVDENVGKPAVLPSL